jgi:hypothetical protein
MKVALVFSDRDSHQHFMTKRLFKRAGLDINNFAVYYSFDPDIISKLRQHRVAVAMGLVPLRALINEYQPFRWLAKHITHPAGFIVVGGMDPIRLLPNRWEDEDDDDGKEEVTRSPARLTGAVALALRKALSLNDNPDLFKVHTDYLIDISPDEFGLWVHRMLMQQPEFLSWDLETSYRQKDKNEMDV